MPHTCLRLAFVAWLAASAMLSGAQTPATVERDGDSIVFRGRIDAGSAAAFLQLLRDPRVQRVVLTSGGGLVGPALDMAEALHARGLDVEVPTLCRSSCANYLVPAGRRKTLGWPGAVAWHGNMAHVLYLAQTGHASWSEPLLAEARALARREAAFYRRIGVDGFVGWFGKIAPYEVPDFYFLGADDLAHFGIADVLVRAGSGPSGAEEGLQPLRIDWDLLAASRPAVDLQDP